MFRGFVHKYMPGLASFIRYDRSWLFSDMGAGLSVAAIAAAESPVRAFNNRVVLEEANGPDSN